MAIMLLTVWSVGSRRRTTDNLRLLTEGGHGRQQSNNMAIVVSSLDLYARSEVSTTIYLPFVYRESCPRLLCNLYTYRSIRKRLLSAAPDAPACVCISRDNVATGAAFASATGIEQTGFAVGDTQVRKASSAWTGEIPGMSRAGTL
jgi:hypothetical protein